MFFLITVLLATICTSKFVYFEQYLKLGNIIYWSLPLLLIGFILAIIMFVILVLYICTLFIRPDKELTRQRTLYIYMIKIISEFLTGLLRIKIVFLNNDKIPQERQFLLVGNHQSNLDPIICIWAFRKFNIAFIMKDNIMKVPVVGRWLYGGGFLPLNRKNDRKALETIVIATKRISENRHPIAVYPEGTRSKGPEVKEFRNGVFKIAQKAKCPIVVVAIDNAYRIKKYYPFRRTKVLLEVCDVIEYDQFKDMNTNDLGDMVHQKMTETLDKRRKEFKWLKAVNENKKEN